MLPPSWLCSTSIRISSGEWSRSASLGGLMPKKRSRRLAAPLSSAIGPAITQAKPISGTTTHELTSSGKSSAIAFGTSSPRTMCSTVMMANAMPEATACVAIRSIGAGSQVKPPSIRCASAGSPIQPETEGGERDAELGGGDVAVERLNGPAGEPSFAVAVPSHLLEARLSGAHQRKLRGDEECVCQNQHHHGQQAERGGGRLGRFHISISLTFKRL